MAARSASRKPAHASTRGFPGGRRCVVTWIDWQHPKETSVRGEVSLRVSDPARCGPVGDMQHRRPFTATPLISDARYSGTAGNATMKLEDTSAGLPTRPAPCASAARGTIAAAESELLPRRA